MGTPPSAPLPGISASPFGSRTYRWSADERSRGDDRAVGSDEHHLAVALLEVVAGAVGPPDEHPALLVDLEVLAVAVGRAGHHLVAVEPGHDVAVGVADDGLTALAGHDVLPPVAAGDRAAARPVAVDLLLVTVPVEPEQRRRIARGGVRPCSAGLSGLGLAGVDGPEPDGRPDDWPEDLAERVLAAAELRREAGRAVGPVHDGLPMSMAATSPMSRAGPITPSRSSSEVGSARRLAPDDRLGAGTELRASRSRNQNATSAPPNHTNAAAVSHPLPAASSGTTSTPESTTAPRSRGHVAPVEAHHEQAHQRADRDGTSTWPYASSRPDDHHGGQRRRRGDDPAGDDGEPAADAGGEPDDHTAAQGGHRADDTTGSAEPRGEQPGRQRAHQEGHRLPGRGGRGEPGASGGAGRDGPRAAAARTGAGSTGHDQVVSYGLTTHVIPGQRSTPGDPLEATASSRRTARWSRTSWSTTRSGTGAGRGGGGGGRTATEPGRPVEARGARVPW